VDSIRFIKISNIIFRIVYDETDPECGLPFTPNRPTVFIDTDEQLSLINKLLSDKRTNKPKKISGYYFSDGFDYVFKNLKIINMWVDIKIGSKSAAFYSKALNEKYSNRYKASLYTIGDLRQMVTLKIIIKSNKGLRKFNL